jgi:hypothetical protein
VKKLKCNVCGVAYWSPKDFEYAEKMSKEWAESCKADGVDPKGICPCPNLTCPGELVVKEI